MRRIGGTDSIEARIMKRAAVERSWSGPRQPRKVGPTSARRMASIAGAAAAGCFRGLQLVEPLAVGGKAAGDEQFGDQFVLGAEMIVHRREIDVGRRDDVAQRDVGEAAIGIEPFGGVQDRGSGVVRRHRHGPMRKPGSCNSNSCMKLWFEGRNVNAQGASALRPNAGRRHRRAARRDQMGLAADRRRGDSAANDFEKTR